MVSNLDKQCKNYGIRISRDKTQITDSVWHRISTYGVYLLGKVVATELSKPGILPPFTYSWAQRHQQDHQDTYPKSGIHPKSTLQE